MAAPFVIAGGGIGGLSAALALAQRGLPSIVLEQAERIEATGAGIQLSPNAVRVLSALGLADRLRPQVVAPDAVLVRSARGRPLARIPLGEHAAARYGAPYWVIHRGDLQGQLFEAVRREPLVELKLATRLEDVAVHGRGITVAGRRGTSTLELAGTGLIGADGLWSNVRKTVGVAIEPAFRNRTAWRMQLPIEQVPELFREHAVQLWLGSEAHFVAYPVQGGAQLNVVAIVGERMESQAWSEPGDATALLARFSRWRWAAPVRELIAQAERWHKWALADLPSLPRWSQGPVTLLGDAAHPMLPFMAQGAAAALEDAMTLAAEAARTPNDPAAAFRQYERARRRRTAGLQRLARRNGETYHLGGAEAAARNLVLRLLSGERLLRRFDWIYRWTPPQGPAASKRAAPPSE